MQKILDNGNDRFVLGSHTGGIAIFTVDGMALLINIPAETGTGGVIDDLNLLRQRALEDRGIAPMSGLLSDNMELQRTPIECLNHIRTVLSPAISDLATAFDVSRQTIYNWQKGEQPKQEHLEKLMDLAGAADVFVNAGIVVTTTLLKRKITDGKNLLSLLKSGSSVNDAARTLVGRLQSEQKQKELLAVRFANRKNSKPHEESDFPAPNDPVV